MTKCFEIEKSLYFRFTHRVSKAWGLPYIMLRFFVRELFVSRPWKPLTKGKWRKGEANIQINLTLLNLCLVQ